MGAKFFTVCIIVVMCAFCVYGQERIYLPDIEVTETKETGTVITREEIERYDATDLAQAIQHVPGIIITGGGSRNDTSFTVRGFGADSVPVYIDGIVISNPYRGEGDAARLLTGDLESITLFKGSSSTLLGANNLGGAIVMHTAKPKKPLEFLFNSSFDFDSRFSYASSTSVLAAGTKQNKFYIRGVYQYRDVDHFRLSSDFKPNSINPQKKGNRMWSDFEDTKITLIAGITPTSSLDIWGTYVYQDSDKGMSPPETTIKGYNIWEWSDWTRKSASLNGSYEGSSLSVKMSGFYDKYDNSMNEYYTMSSYQAGVHAPASDYDEYTYGGRIEASLQIDSRNKVSLGSTYKKENHKSLKAGKKILQVEEDTFSTGIEYITTPFDKWTFTAGLGFDTLLPRKYWDKNNELAQKLGRYYVVKSKDKWVFTGQLGIFYEFIEEHELHLTFARKSHYPSMSQRYSTRFGQDLPNPSLDPEVADHYEFGYKGRPFSLLEINASVYYSVIKDKIVNIEIPNPDNPVAVAEYARNLDEVAFYGLELSAIFYIGDKINAGINFSYNKYSIDKNKSGEIKEINYYPEIAYNLYMDIRPVANLSIMPRMEYVGSRYAKTDGIDKLDSYTLCHIKADYYIMENLKISARIDNIFDELYEIKQYYPLAGRTYGLALALTY